MNRTSSCFDLDRQRLIEHHCRILTAEPRIDCSTPKCYRSSPISIHYRPLRKHRSSSLCSFRLGSKSATAESRSSGISSKTDVMKSEFEIQNEHPLTRLIRNKARSKLSLMDCYRAPSSFPVILKKEATDTAGTNNRRSNNDQLKKSTVNDFCEYNFSKSVSSNDITSENSSVQNVNDDLSSRTEDASVYSNDGVESIQRFKTRVLDDVIRRQLFTDRQIIRVIKQHRQSCSNMDRDLMEQATQEILQDLEVKAALYS
uniref:Uncharacterized protein n=1 Tax=Syphacia muris TaxID=451379 RepID=A0A0N5APB6_9BILA